MVGGLGLLECGARVVVRGVWCLGCGAWSAVIGVRCLEYDVHSCYRSIN